MKIEYGMTLYCRFRTSKPIESVRVGPRGGLYALVDGSWRYARRTRSKADPRPAK